MTYFLGDVHGQSTHLRATLADLPKNEDVIQVGDLGIGLCQFLVLPPNFKFIRGNHDNPYQSRAHTNYLGEYGVLVSNQESIFFVSGAASIDRGSRVENFNWWKDEEISYTDMHKALDLWMEWKPEIMVTHDGPRCVVENMLSKEIQKTRTNQFLDILLEKHSPNVWVFGHHHVDKTFPFGDTLFCCLGELSLISLEQLADFGG